METAITTIVPFKIPAENVYQFFAFWQDDVKDNVGKQPGLIDGVFYRGIDPVDPFSSSTLLTGKGAEQLAAALQAASEDLPIAKVFRDLGVKVSQNNYVEAVRYAPPTGPA